MLPEYSAHVEDTMKTLNAKLTFSVTFSSGDVNQDRYTLLM